MAFLVCVFLVEMRLFLLAKLAIHGIMRALEFGVFLIHLNIGSLAQLVEQETLNLLVVGSSPTRPTIEVIGHCSLLLS